MPYIPQSDRASLDGWGSASTSGHLNYQITRLLVQYLEGHGRQYSTMNEIIGALECAKAEFTRRVLNPHEDKKRKENGDVYPEGLDY